MPQIEIAVPGMLANTIGGQRSNHVEADTLRDVLAKMRAAFPLLTPHVYDDAGNIRKHVLVYLNDESITWIDDWDRPLKTGDKIQVIQAISGG